VPLRLQFSRLYFIRLGNLLNFFRLKPLHVQQDLLQLQASLQPGHPR